MSELWSYRLAVGVPDGVVLDWQTTSAERTGTPDLTTGGTPGLLLEGVQLVRRLPEGEPWPCQPEAAVLTFQVAAPTAAELAESLPFGAAVAYRIGQGAGPNGRPIHAEGFTGYVTDVTLEAREDYTVATVTAMDWVAALAEVVIGAEPWPLESVAGRIDRVMAEVAAEAPELPSVWAYNGDTDSVPGAGEHVAVAEQDVDARTALDVLRQLLGLWVLAPHEHLDPRYGGYSRYVWSAMHGITYVSGIEWEAGNLFLASLVKRPHSWLMSAYTVAPSEDAPPALFAETSPGLWGVVMDPEPVDAPTLPAAAVELPAKWAQRIGGIPNTAVVVVPFAGYTAGQGLYVWRWSLPQTVAGRDHRVRIKREVPIEFGVPADASYQSGVSATFMLSYLLIPNTVNPHTAWATDELTWRASHTDGFLPWPFRLGGLLTVTDVDPAAHPAGSPWIHGQVDSYSVRVVDGFPQVTFTTRPQLRDSIHPDVLTLADVPAGVTLAELDPALTVHDLRLLRAA